MSREVHVRFCESVGVRFPRATRRNVYVRSERAGLRVMDSIEKFLSKKLKLKVNRHKSAVAKPQKRKFLGFSFTSNRWLKIKLCKRQDAPTFSNRFQPGMNLGCGLLGTVVGGDLTGQ